MTNKIFVIEQYEIHSRDVHLEGSTPEEAVADYILGRQQGLKPKSATFVGIDMNHGCVEEDQDPVLADLANQVQDYGVRLTRDGMLESIVNIRRRVCVLRKMPKTAQEVQNPVYWEESKRIWVQLQQATLYQVIEDREAPEGCEFSWEHVQVRLDDPRLNVLDSIPEPKIEEVPEPVPPPDHYTDRIGAETVARLERELADAKEIRKLFSELGPVPGETRTVYRCANCGQLLIRRFIAGGTGMGVTLRNCICGSRDEQPLAPVATQYP